VKELPVGYSVVRIEDSEAFGARRSSYEARGPF
jgi:hypothetical protein